MMAAIVERSALAYLTGEGMAPDAARQALQNATPAATWDGARYFTLKALSRMARA